MKVPRLTWPLTFRRLRDSGSKDPRPPADTAPAPLPSAPEKTTPGGPIKLSQAQEVALTGSLRSRVTRILKDLSLDRAGANMPAVVGGKNQPKRSDGSPDDSAGRPKT
jgi:hypothetical protein